MKYLRWRLYQFAVLILIIFLIVFGITFFSSEKFEKIFDSYEEVNIDTTYWSGESVQKEKTGEFIVLNDVELGTTLNINNKPNTVFAVGTNWFPVSVLQDGNKLVINQNRSTYENDYINQIELPTHYPAGEYRFGAIVTTTNKNEERCYVGLYNDEEMIVNASIIANTNAATDVYLNAESSFNKIVIYSSKDKVTSSGHSAEFSNLFLRYGNRSAKEYEEYCGKIYNLPQEKIIVQSRPLYLFSADGKEMKVEYTKGNIDLENYYFKDNYLPNKVNTINTLMENAGENSDAFVFITDLHLENNKNAKNYLPLLEYVNKHTTVNRVIVGGDMCSGATQSGLTQVATEIEKAFSNGNIHYVIGNHEYDAGVTDDVLYNVYNRGKTEQIGNNERNYYYVDNKEKKMRYVVLNPYKQAADGSGTVNGWDKQQKDWLDNIALDVEDGWGIIISIHHVWANDYKSDLQASIDRYNGKGEIIAVFHGHLHADSISRTTGGTPCIGVACDKNNSENDTLMKTERIVGTISEQAFDVVIVDRNAKKLHCVRIGALALDGNGNIGNKQVEIRTVNF